MKTNHQKAKEQGNTSGAKTSESSSWESIILETPNGVRKEYVVKPPIEPEQLSKEPNLEPPK